MKPALFKSCNLDFSAFLCFCVLDFFAAGKFRGFRTKTTGLHVALREYNSGTESGRELFKGSKDLASLVVCNEQQFFGWGCSFFVSDIVSKGLLGHLDPLYLALGPNH